jgi:hypothetical protein
MGGREIACALTRSCAILATALVLAGGWFYLRRSASSVARPLPAAGQIPR